MARGQTRRWRRCGQRWCNYRQGRSFRVGAESGPSTGDDVNFGFVFGGGLSYFSVPVYCCQIRRGRNASRSSVKRFARGVVATGATLNPRLTRISLRKWPASAST